MMAITAAATDLIRMHHCQFTRHKMFNNCRRIRDTVSVSPVDINPHLIKTP